MKSVLLKLLTVLSFVLAFSVNSGAQFKKDAFTQNYNDKSEAADSTDKLFTFKEYFGGLSHKDTARIGVVFAGSTVFVGGMQIYNKDYWKLPIVYGGIAAGVTGGIIYGKKGNKRASTLCYAGAGLVYWGSLMDGVIRYKPAEYPKPGKATLYSLLLPGLGQAYNGEYWKIPIYSGIMIGGVHFWVDNQKNFDRFRKMYKDLDAGIAEDCPYSKEKAKYYRDAYRRLRDYSILTVFGGYLLQVIDANVFAYMHNFNVNDDLSLSVGPRVLAPDNEYAFCPDNKTGIGMGISLRF